MLLSSGHLCSNKRIKIKGWGVVGRQSQELAGRQRDLKVQQVYQEPEPGRQDVLKSGATQRTIWQWVCEGQGLKKTLPHKQTIMTNIVNSFFHSCSTTFKQMSEGDFYSINPTLISLLIYCHIILTITSNCQLQLPLTFTPHHDWSICLN